MSQAVAVVEEIAPKMRADALLCDINSLKVEVCQALAKSAGEALGTHPMFGPTVHTLEHQKVVLCNVKPGPRAQSFTKELEALGMDLVQASPEEHDRMMAVVQVLVHFNTLVMGEALRRTGVSIDESLRFTSPIYQLELAFVGRLFAQSADLYGEIEMQNPFGDEMRDHFLAAARSLEAPIKAGDRRQFNRIFNSLRAYFADFAPRSLELSNGLIDKIAKEGLEDKSCED